jgi:hypothetical protein
MHPVPVVGMDELLTLLLVLLVFAGFIFLVQRSVKTLAILGVALGAVYLLSYLGIVSP